MRKERDSAGGVGVPRNRALCRLRFLAALGGVGDPVVVELEHVVSRCHQPKLRLHGGSASSHEVIDAPVVFDLPEDRLDRDLRARLQLRLIALLRSELFV